MMRDSMRMLALGFMIATALGAPVALGAFGDAKPGQVEIIQNPLTATARFQPSAVEAGGSADLLIDLQLADGYHAYLDRFKLAFESPDDLKLADFKITPIVRFMDSISKKEKDGVKGKALLRALVEVPRGFKEGKYPTRIKLTYQACTAEHCLFPKIIELTAPLTVSLYRPIPELHEAKGPAVAMPAAAANDFESQLNKSTFSAFLLVFVFGFLTCLTPCIYPMIPITLAVLGARAPNQSHARSFALAFVYVLGIALTYAVMGVIAASTGSFLGAALGNIWVVSALAGVFVLMALSMFGAFELQAPAFLRDRLGAAPVTKGFSGAFISGLVAGIVASPCIGPVLLSLLAWIAKTQNQTLGFMMLFTFAFGMGLPFIALGLSSSWIAKLPKSGRWMESVKSLFALAMLGMAFYYIRPLYPNWLFTGLLGMTLVALASWFGAFEPASNLAPLARLRKGAMLALLAVGLALVVSATFKKAGVLGQALSLPGAEKPASLMKWQPYSSAALDAALKSGKPVLIDFTAEWCGACHEMDASVFIDAKIVETSMSFALLQVDGTEDTPALREILKRFDIKGFPTYIFFDSKGVQRQDLTLLGLVPTNDFHRNMMSALSARPL